MGTGWEPLIHQLLLDQYVPLPPPQLSVRPLIGLNSFLCCSLPIPILSEREGCCGGWLVLGYFAARFGADIADLSRGSWKRARVQLRPWRQLLSRPIVPATALSTNSSQLSNILSHRPILPIRGLGVSETRGM